MYELRLPVKIHNVDWFLDDIGLRRERVNQIVISKTLSLFAFYFLENMKSCNIMKFHFLFFRYKSRDIFIIESFDFIY